MEIPFKGETDKNPPIGGEFINTVTELEPKYFDPS
jgi:hypothetical protein